MAFNSYYPTYPQGYPQAYPQNNSNIYWVQGIEGAKAYPVGAGNSVLLMDSDNSVMYIKTADQAGVPSLRVFEYVEKTDGKSDIDMSAYVTRQEFNDLVSKMTEKKKKKKHDDDDDEE